MTAYDILQPIFRILPEVPKPAKRPSLRERLIWTGLVLAIYFAMCQVPLYGVAYTGQQYNPLLFLQVIMASRRGTLMELGISPIVTAGIIWELLVGSQIVTLDLTTREGRIVFAGVQKILAIIFAGLEASAYIVGGVYGNLSLGSAFLVFLQLLAASIIVLLMDEMLQKGWGIGSAISLFIAAGVARSIFWQLFSPMGPLRDGLYYGALPAISQAFFSGNSTLISEVIVRRAGYPCLLGLLSMVFFLLLLTYLESIRLEIPVTVRRYGGIKSKIPLKFLYVSNIPVILVSALYADIHIFARALWPRLNPNNDNPMLNWLVMYNNSNGVLVPLKGSLVYYLTPPRSLYAIYEDPVHVVVYSLIFIVLCVLFAIAWVSTSGMDPRGQAEQLIRSEMHIPGFRSSKKVLEVVLSKYIWPLTILSGLLVGIIAVVAGLLGTLGSGIGILLMVGILVQYQAMLARERALEMYPMLSRLLKE